MRRLLELYLAIATPTTPTLVSGWAFAPSRERHSSVPRRRLGLPSPGDVARFGEPAGDAEEMRDHLGTCYTQLSSPARLQTSSGERRQHSLRVHACVNSMPLGAAPWNGSAPERCGACAKACVVTGGLVSAPCGRSRPPHSLHTSTARLRAMGHMIIGAACARACAAASLRHPKRARARHRPPDRHADAPCPIVGPSSALTRAIFFPCARARAAACYLCGRVLVLPLLLLPLPVPPPSP